MTLMKKSYIEPTTEALELTLGSSLLQNSVQGDSGSDIIIDDIIPDAWGVFSF